MKYFRPRRRYNPMSPMRETVSDISLYRIVRNEDVLLQRNGMKVVRLLLEEICENLDYVLKQIPHKGSIARAMIDVWLQE